MVCDILHLSSDRKVLHFQRPESSGCMYVCMYVWKNKPFSSFSRQRSNPLRQSLRKISGEEFRKYSYLNEVFIKLWLKSYESHYYRSYRPSKNYKSYQKMECLCWSFTRILSAGTAHFMFTSLWNLIDS